MDEKKALELMEKYGKASQGYAPILRHVKAVRKLAVQWARRIKANGYRVDVDFVSTASLIHDIGRFRYSLKDPGVIRHGIDGASILRKEGYPLHARLAERHIGAGITKSDIKEQGLDLPLKDYVPLTIEEKIIACADNLMEGSRKLTIEEAVKDFERKVNKECAKKVLDLHKEIESMLRVKKKAR